MEEVPVLGVMGMYFAAFFPLLPLILESLIRSWSEL